MGVMNCFSSWRFYEAAKEFLLWKALQFVYQQNPIKNGHGLCNVMTLNTEIYTQSSGSTDRL